MAGSVMLKRENRMANLHAAVADTQSEETECENRVGEWGTRVRSYRR